MYYWIERNYDVIFLVALMIFTILARLAFGLWGSLAPLFFFAGALVLLRIYLRLIKVRPIGYGGYFALIGLTLFYALIVIVSFLH